MQAAGLLANTHMASTASSLSRVAREFGAALNRTGRRGIHRVRYLGQGKGADADVMGVWGRTKGEQQAPKEEKNLQIAATRDMARGV